MSAAGESPPGPVPTFDPHAWRPGRARAVAALLEAVFAAGAWSQGAAGRAAAVALVLDTAIQLLPWRLPRSRRSIASVWTEAMLYLAMPAAFAVAMLARGQVWFSAAGLTPVWLGAAVAAGGFLVWAGGMSIPGLISGVVPAVAPPVRRAHKAERVTSAALAPAGEEFLFRGTVLAVPHAAAVPFGLLAGTGFAARHHVAPGASARTSGRTLLTHCAAAAILLVLTLGSHSLFPALIAHGINNLPSIAFEAMRPVLTE